MKPVISPALDLIYNAQQDGYDWHSLGDDPAFWVRLDSSVGLAAGNYRLILRIESDLPEGMAKLYFDRGEGLSERQVVYLPFKNNITASRIFAVPYPVKSIRFDPFECSAQFTVHQFEIEPLDATKVLEYFTDLTRRKLDVPIDLSVFRLSSVYDFYDELLRTGQDAWLNASKQTIAVPYRTLPEASAYAAWHAGTRPNQNVLAKQSVAAAKWKTRPLLSIVVPCYNSNPIWIEQLLDSIAGQSYSNWECIIVDDASLRIEHLDVASRFVKSDSRFQLHICLKNLGVGGTSHKGVELTTGGYVAVVDHDDLLEPDALFEVADVVRKKSVDVLYSDEALVDEFGNMIRCDFRPDFDYAMLLSHPYIVHLTFFKRDVVMSVGNFRKDYTISQDYDLLLRVASQTKDFFHIPKVLYRWRTHTTSTGHSGIDHVTSHSVNALNNHLKLAGHKKTQAWIEAGLSFNFFRFRSKIKPCTIRVIIPTKDRVDLLKTCIDTLLGVTKLPESVKLYVTIVDNGSVENKTLEYLKNIQSDTIHVLNCPGAFNFSRLNNLAAEQSADDFLLFLNNDIEIVDPDWLEAMLEVMYWQDVGVVGAKLLYPETGLVQHGGVMIGFNGIAAHDHQFYPERQNDHWAPGHLHTLFTIRECSAVTAACLLMRRTAFDSINGFDELFAVGFGDTDLCLRAINSGWRCLFTPYARLIHHESASRGYVDYDPHPDDTARFKKRWAKFIKAGDPYYNANLCLAGEPYNPSRIEQKGAKSKK